MLLMSTANFFQNSLFSKNPFRNPTRVSNSLDSDQDPCSVSSDLGLNCLQRISATFKERANLQQTTISNFAAFSKITNKAWYFMRIVCWQTILMIYHTLFFSEIRKDVAKFVVCCSRDWRFKGKGSIYGNMLPQ